MWGAIKGLVKMEYHQARAVDGIDFRVREGEIRAIIGPNGAGKSTTLKILSGILYPTAGIAWVMGMVPWEERKRLVRNLAGVMGKPVRQLSLGEWMKCEFACALLHEAALVILDEPAIGLDLFSKEEIREFIHNMNEERGTTFLITTHDLNDVEELCGNITVVNQGKVKFDDTMEHLKTYDSHRWILELTFGKKVERELLRDYAVIDFQELSATVVGNLWQRKLEAVIAEIWSKLPLTDLNVKNISIEDVMKEIY